MKVTGTLTSFYISKTNKPQRLWAQFYVDTEVQSNQKYLSIEVQMELSKKVINDKKALYSSLRFSSKWHMKSVLMFNLMKYQPKHVISGVEQRGREIKMMV